MLLDVQTILVPQGAEYRAVCRGLRDVLNPPAVFPIPVGPTALTATLERLQQAGCLFDGQHLLVMGLCGSLTPDLTVGTEVLYEACVSTQPAQTGKWLECDRGLTSQIHTLLGGAIPSVKAVTSDRVISRSLEKRQLAQTTQAEVVDMEGFAALAVLTGLGVAVATLRVISDDSQHDIPDLSHAFAANGSLKPVSLALALLKQPIAAVGLIRGSLKSLKILQNLTSELFKNSL